MKPAPLTVRLYWTAYTVWHARLERALPYWPERKLRALQDSRARAIVRHAYRTVPFYREQMDRLGVLPGDVRCADDLARLPVVTIDDYARDPDDFLSAAYRGAKTFQAFTSGTSGHARVIHFNSASLFQSLAARRRRHIVVSTFVGRSRRYSEMMAASAATLSVRLREFYEMNSAFPRAVDLRRTHMLSFGHPDEKIAELNSAKPEVFGGYGSFIGLLYRWAWQHDLPIHRPKLVHYGGDCMSEQDRAIIERHFGVPVHSSYQSTEAMAIAYQCELLGGFHIEMDQTAVRVVDRNGKPVGPGGTGEIFVSNLTNRATVLLNFRLGDIVTLGREPCPCGRTLPTIQRIDGRADDVVVHPDGHLMHSMIAIGKIQFVPGVLQLQLVQEELRRFLVRYVLRRGADASEVERSLDAKLRETYGAGIDARIERVEFIPPEPSGKVKLVSSRCMPSSPDEVSAGGEGRSE